MISLLGIFFSTNFETNLGNIFSIVILAATIAYVLDKKHAIDIETNENKTKSILYTVGAYLLFIFSSSFIIPLIFSVVKFFDPSLTINLSAFTLNSIINTFSQTNLALTGNSILQFLALTFFIAPAETVFFFGTLYEYLLDKFKAVLGFNVKNASIILILASIFTYIHITAKGVSNNEALLLVFYFAVISMVLITVTKQLLEAILLHVIANGVAGFSLIGVTVSGMSIVLYAAGFGVLLYLLTRKFSFKQFKLTRNL